MCRYGARSPIANSRLSLDRSGRVLLSRKRPLRDGRTELAFDPTEFLRRLATLIPPPRAQYRCRQNLASCTHAGDDHYDAYSGAKGAVCGEGPNGGTVFCKPGDSCLAQADASCTHTSDGNYDAYAGAGGAACGEGPNGGTVFCVGGDTCLGQTEARCHMN